MKTNTEIMMIMMMTTPIYHVELKKITSNTRILDISKKASGEFA
jgi:hypothetical protein